MYILAADTTGPVGSAAILNTETGELKEERSSEPMAHLKMLVPMIQKLHGEFGIQPKDLAAAAASVGPGSYTGIRIGVSTIRGIAQALDIPCVRIGTLDSFRLKTGRRAAAAILNARRGQVYGAVFDVDGSEILKPGPYMLEDVTRAVDRAGIDPVFFGDGIDAYAGSEKFGSLLEGRTFAPEEDRYQTAAMTARAAAAEIEAGRTCSFLELLPDYMRKTEAETKLADGSLARARAAKMAKFRGR